MSDTSYKYKPADRSMKFWTFVSWVVFLAFVIGAWVTL